MTNSIFTIIVIARRQSAAVSESAISISRTFVFCNPVPTSNHRSTLRKRKTDSRVDKIDDIHTAGPRGGKHFGAQGVDTATTFIVVGLVDGWRKNDKTEEQSIFDYLGSLFLWRFNGDVKIV